MNQPRSLAARAGRWSATHRKTAIWGWLAFVILAFAIGGAVGTQASSRTSSGSASPGAPTETIEGAFPRSAEELVLIQSDTETATDPSFRAAVADVQRRLQQVPYADEFESPYAAGNSGQISADGHSALLRFKIAGDDTEAQDRVGAGPCGGQRRAGGQSGLHDRRVRRRQRQQAAQRVDQRRLQAGAVHLAADHPADPADRVRRPGGCRRAAAAGAHRGAGDDRADGPDQPHSAEWTARSTR